MSDVPSGTQESAHPNSELISLYHDGEGDAQLLRSVEQHLDSCAECRAQLEALRTLSAAMGTLPEESAPNELFARVSDQIRRTPEPRIAPGPIIPMWVGQAAAVLIVSILGIVYWRSWQDSAPRVELAMDRSPPAASSPGEITPEKPARLQDDKIARFEENSEFGSRDRQAKLDLAEAEEAVGNVDLGATHTLESGDAEQQREESRSRGTPELARRMEMERAEESTLGGDPSARRRAESKKVRRVEQDPSLTYRRPAAGAKAEGNELKDRGDGFAQWSRGAVQLRRVEADAPMASGTRELRVAGAEGRDIAALERTLRQWMDAHAETDAPVSEDVQAKPEASLDFDRELARDETDADDDDGDHEHGEPDSLDAGETVIAIDIEVPVDRVDEFLALVSAWQAPPAPALADMEPARRDAPGATHGEPTKKRRGSRGSQRDARPAGDDDRTGEEADAGGAAATDELDLVEPDASKGEKKQDAAGAPAPGKESPARMRFRLIVVPSAAPKNESPAEPSKL